MGIRSTALLCGLLALVIFSAAAQAGRFIGGSVAPTNGGRAGKNGGAVYGQPGIPAKPTRIKIQRFAVSPTAVTAGARSPLTFRYRIAGRRGQRVTVRIDLLRRGDRRPLRRVRIANRLVRRTYRYRLRARSLPVGNYIVKIAARVQQTRFERPVRASDREAVSILPKPAPPAPQANTYFPIRGPHQFGDGIGVWRGDHVHQGQDIPAAMGTPVVSPRAGTVVWRSYQAGGAGYYLVVRGDDRRDYVFMHLQENSLLVDRGATVQAGQQIASVGSTGGSSGPHLHFEIWPNGWLSSKQSKPIDPLPELRRWVGA